MPLLSVGGDRRVGPDAAVRHGRGDLQACRTLLGPRRSRAGRKEAEPDDGRLRHSNKVAETCLSWGKYLKT